MAEQCQHAWVMTKTKAGVDVAFCPDCQRIERAPSEANAAPQATATAVATAPVTASAPTATAACSNGSCSATAVSAPAKDGWYLGKWLGR